MSVQPAQTHENTYTTAEFEADYALMIGLGSTENRPSLRAEYAIQLPDGLWWREFAARAADPDAADEPTIYLSRAAAFDALADVIAMAEQLFGVINYRPTVVIRRVVDHAGARAAMCAWRGLEVTR